VALVFSNGIIVRFIKFNSILLVGFFIQLRIVPRGTTIGSFLHSCMVPLVLPAFV
jgi:hypothetical protein